MIAGRRRRRRRKKKEEEGLERGVDAVHPQLFFFPTGKKKGGGEIGNQLFLHENDLLRDHSTDFLSFLPSPFFGEGEAREANRPPPHSMGQTSVSTCTQHVCNMTKKRTTHKRCAFKD